MRFATVDLDNLTPKQKDKIDCHRLITSRTDASYPDNTRRIIEFPFQRKENSNFELLPKEEAYTFVKYFSQDHPNDQLWDTPALIHYIGSVDFDKATVYCGRDTRLLLEAAGTSQKPEIYYKYILHGREVEADSRYVIEQVAYQIKRDRRMYREYLEEYPNEEAVGHRALYPGNQYGSLFGSSDDEDTDNCDSDYALSSEDSSCQVKAVKKYKSDPNLIPDDE
jgi:hypothetical protein